MPMFREQSGRLPPIDIRLIIIIFDSIKYDSNIMDEYLGKKKTIKSAIFPLMHIENLI